MNHCLACGKKTTTPSHTSRKKKYCDNVCQNKYEKLNGLRGDGTPTIISADELRRLYMDEKKSCLAIGKLIGKSIRQVSRYLKSIGVPARPFSTKGLQTRKGAVLSKETRLKISIKHRGALSSNWKGGVTPIHKKERATLEIKLWRRAVLERDNYTCQVCGIRKKKWMEADHIKSFVSYPELRTSIENGRTLCNPCHRKTDTYGARSHRKN